MMASLGNVSVFGSWNKLGPSNLPKVIWNPGCYSMSETVKHTPNGSKQEVQNHGRETASRPAARSNNRDLGVFFISKERAIRKRDSRSRS